MIFGLIMFAIGVFSGAVIGRYHAWWSAPATRFAAGALVQYIGWPGKVTP